jgi:polyisoprenoid-binding protein YceI
MKKFILISLLLIAGLATKAQQKVTSYSVKFKIKNFGLTVDGSLKGMVYSINFNLNNLENSKIKTSVKVKTINTGISARDKHLKSDDYFDAEKYPEITLESTKFTKLSENKYTGFFNLTIKNVTKEISFPFTYTTSGNKGNFTGTFTINRRDYGVGGSSLSMGDNVTVNISVSVEN